MLRLFNFFLDIEARILAGESVSSICADLNDWGVYGPELPRRLHLRLHHMELFVHDQKLADARMLRAVRAPESVTTLRWKRHSGNQASIRAAMVRISATDTEVKRVVSCKAIWQVHAGEWRWWRQALPTLITPEEESQQRVRECLIVWLQRNWTAYVQGEPAALAACWNIANGLPAGDPMLRAVVACMKDHWCTG